MGFRVIVAYLTAPAVLPMDIIIIAPIRRILKIMEKADICCIHSFSAAAAN